MHDVDTDSINTQSAYLMYSVFQASAHLPADDADRAALVDDVLRRLEGLDGLTVRGWYDVSGFRADADLMVWWWAPSVETLQAAYHLLLGSALGAHLTPVWSQVGIHRPAEFNRSHVPAFLMGTEPGDYLCVYPFVRSYEWYLLPDAERSTMLRDHGLAARDYPDVLANTVAAFALGDYEWLLGFEAGDLGRIVDLMRELRATEARRHVRDEVPFYTGPRAPLGEIVDRLPWA
ncbi:hydrogen peroxide-dependent heme synthase [Georgenia sp. MJ170]|uniref:hydrogen peroxide-dependent heme synthase n=1 Tax=Georgenia sunbinii TaxID=3117728 RepID=UPI002F261B86